MITCLKNELILCPLNLSLKTRKRCKTGSYDYDFDVHYYCYFEYWSESWTLRTELSLSYHKRRVLWLSLRSSFSLLATGIDVGKASTTSCSSAAMRMISDMI